MNRKKRRAIALTFALLALTASLFLTSCGTVLGVLTGGFSKADDDAGNEDIWQGGLIDTLPTETDDGSSDIINNTINDITIEGSQSAVSYASAAGLRSAVSIYCLFEVTVGGNSIWNPIPTTQQYYSTGSGVIYSLDHDGNAFIITNYHVVYSSNSSDGAVSDEIYLYLYGLENEKYAIPATFVGGSPSYDIAVLRVNASEVLKAAYSNGTATAVKVANSDLVVPGQTTVAIGNPSATAISGISVTRGIVSVDSEYIQMSALDGSGQISLRVIRTDTPVNSGNSGGGLFNENGELVGIVNAKSSITNIDNIGYAIPSNIARGIADNVIDNCYGGSGKSVYRGLFGGKIGATALYTEYDTESGLLIKKETVIVASLTSGGLCEGLLEARDRIKSIKVGDNEAISVYRQYQVSDAMFDVRVGEDVVFVIERDGTEMTLTKTVTQNMIGEY